MNRSLNSLRLFAELDVAQVQKIMSTANAKRCWRDQAIFSEADPVSEAFVLLNGSVKLTQSRMNGNELILRLLGRGDIVGRVFGRDGGQCCTARAIQTSELLVWNAYVFESLLWEFPAFCRSTIQALQEQLLEMEERFWGASTQSIGSRLGNELLRLGSKLEQQNARERRILLSHSELAQLTGISPCTISRLLRAWQSQGILAVQRGAISVRNLDALARLAQRE